MPESCLFRLNDDFDQIIELFQLKKQFHDDKVCIYHNDNMRFSFMDHIVMVRLFNKNEQDLKKLYQYFYGENDEDE